MRNVFDQYHQPENRLSHALACSISEDRRLLASFIKWATGKEAPREKRYFVVEQRLPGEDIESSEAEAERRGLPDIWIYGDSTWSLIIESKVSATLTADQLARHLRTADRRGFGGRHLLTLTTLLPRLRASESITSKTWQDLYQWASDCSRWSEWARRLTNYMEVAERRMVADEYLLKGALTVFSGIRFSADEPYSYVEAKRVLRLLMVELRAKRPLAANLGADLSRPGRASITGEGADSVWDFIWLGAAKKESNFTKLPHLTLSIGRDRVLAQITIPNGLGSNVRMAMRQGGYEAFRGMVGQFLANATSTVLRDPGARPFVMLLQRHYPTQRSIPVQDALLEFDPRTAFKGTASAIKYQEEWLCAAYASFVERRHSNLQLGIGVSWAYESSEVVSTKHFAKAVEESWLACAPVLQLLGLIPMPRHPSGAQR